MVGLDRGRVSLEPHRPAWRENYEAELKRSLAERSPEDHDAYIEGKAAFVEGVLEGR